MPFKLCMLSFWTYLAGSLGLPWSLVAMVAWAWVYVGIMREFERARIGS